MVSGLSSPNGASGPIPPSALSCCQGGTPVLISSACSHKGDLVLSKRGQILQKHLMLQVLECKVKPNVLFEVG